MIDARTRVRLVNGSATDDSDLSPSGPGPDLAFLDWPELLARLAVEAQSQRGKQRCLGLLPATTRSEAARRMAEVAEAAALLRAGETLPALPFPEIEAFLDAAETGVPLGPEELKQVAAQCEVAANARRHLLRLGPEAARTGPSATRLSAIATRLSSHEEIVFSARDTFDATGELRDSASPELFRLRRERDQVATRVREQAERLLRSEAYAPYLQDDYVTLREDRFVLPLRASFKSMGLGIVHDTSRSGETVFVEPTQIVELNNRLKVAEIEIRRESRRILEELAQIIAGAAPALRADREILTELDVIFAGARVGLAYDGVEVELTREPVLDLRGLRHPLLALRAAAPVRDKVRERERQVVANDVALGTLPGKSEARILVVSGPNAGGKTVLLKAVGLAAISARAGLLVPAEAGSRLGFFERVLVDVGDQQSVASDLSTFSAHLANIARILAGAAGDLPPEPGREQPHVLCLCDELMAGTHPEQGAALARATLETLAATRALVITTTHYDSLKGLTEGDPRFRNAGMEYDLDNLRPTFRLRDGLPGRSYALDIAQRMGLPAAVLERARALVGHSSLGLEEVLQKLEEREGRLAAAEAALETARAELEARVLEERAAAQALSRRERDLAQKTREVIDNAVRDARDAISEIVRDVRRRRTVEAADTARRKLEETASRAQAGLPEPSKPEFDVARLKEALANRALGMRAEPRPGPQTGGKAGKSSSPPKTALAGDEPPAPAALVTRATSVDVRGLRADEALHEVEAFLDRAALEGADTIAVIHGHGTGALRKVVRELLATSPYVERFRSGGPGEGGDGVSIVSLRG